MCANQWNWTLTSLRYGAALALMGLVPIGASAQQAEPLSAINWLSNTVSTPAAPNLPPITTKPSRKEADVTRSASVESVTVRPLGATSRDGVGILPRSVTGFPADFWGSSDVTELRRALAALPLEQLPAAQNLTRMVLLAEVAPPQNADLSGALFSARLDALLARGLLEETGALLDRAGALKGARPDPALFRRAFDVALLTGQEDQGCDTLRNAPGISPSLPLRIFCLARTGDWPAAALTLETGKALGQLSEAEDALLARFLDPELFEGMADLPLPDPVSPLTFRMHEAIGQPIKTRGLPIAFAHADLRSNLPWRERIAAGERLARVGALSANGLFGIYTERTPSASGGVWERVDAVQRLDRALTAGDAAQVARHLTRAWAALGPVGLRPWMAEVFGPQLAKVELTGAAGTLAFEVLLLTQSYESAAIDFTPTTQRGRFEVALATGRLEGATPHNEQARAISDGFTLTDLPPEGAALIESGQTGAAILFALDLLDSGAEGNMTDLSNAIALLRRLGLEDTARRAGLELLLLPQSAG
ncbi:hypothetical protein IV417_05075 [Alphaproteobacteria bacterium KMM 3653]|uniref:Uncharacterized protein n=1 Tax=Harenicola maris TaxID=2841044 RepID=A0AAP2CP91_9RHOB|nr:hypothetical protein [Harenicola maris]